MKTPRTKLQAPEKVQISRCNTLAGRPSFEFGDWDFFGAECLGFEICHLVNRKSENERPSLRLPPTAEEPGLHRRGRAHARAGRRNEHGHVQRAQCVVASRSALSEFRTTRARLPHVTAIAKLAALGRQFPRSSRAKQRLRADGGL